MGFYRGSSASKLSLEAIICSAHSYINLFTVHHGLLCLYFSNMKFELIKYQKSNYQACSPANYLNNPLAMMAFNQMLSVSSLSLFFVFVFAFLSVIVFAFVSPADHVETPTGDDGVQQDVVFVFVFI